MSVEHEITKSTAKSTGVTAVSPLFHYIQGLIHRFFLFFFIYICIIFLFVCLFYNIFYLELVSCLVAPEKEIAIYQDTLQYY